MQVRVDYPAHDGSSAGAAGTFLLFDEDRLLRVLETPEVKSETLLFVFDGSLFQNGGTALVADADDSHKTLLVVAHETPGQDVALVDEQGEEVGRSESFEIRATRAGIVVADAQGRPLVQWLVTPQSWWRQGRELGKRLSFALATVDVGDISLFAPSVRERLSSLAQ